MSLQTSSDKQLFMWEYDDSLQVKTTSIIQAASNTTDKDIKTH